MLYPYNLEQKLGFDKIKDLLNELCISSLGRYFVGKIRFSERAEQVEKMLWQVAEMQGLIQAGQALPAQNFYDCTPYLNALKVEGNFLNEEAYFELMLSVKSIAEIVIFLKKQDQNCKNLSELLNLATQAEDGTTFDIKETYKNIQVVIDERGKLRDSASTTLQKIRKDMYSIEHELRKKLDSLFRHARNSGWISDDFSLTVRNGRLVMPITAEYKRKIKGFIHDESDSGKTVFLEPAEVLDLNNELKELEAAERREIIKILSELANSLRPQIPQLRRCFTFLGLIDFIRAKALLAIELEAILPLLQRKPKLHIKNGRHPLLFLSFKKLGKKVVPLNISLPDNTHILVVSGPNAGGKSVMLKTTGLLQYMLQCGLLVPVAEGTEMGLFKNLFMDIGDEQSIENDLSTYSSHLSNMKYFTENANASTLFLIDEFGTGTEPNLGGAIAESILEELLASKAYGIINTHYSNLKYFANKTAGLINGAMRFDAEHLEPLFELEIGQPGSSFALEIAQKIGLKKKIVHNAKQKLGNKQVNLEKLLKELEIEKKVFSEKNIEFNTKQRLLDENLQQYIQLKEVLEQQKKTILNTAKSQAKELLAEANQKIERTIKEIKEQKAEKVQTKELRNELQSFEQQLKPEKVAIKNAQEIKPEAGAITVGTLVRIKGQDTVAEVLALKGKDAEVAIGGLKSNIKLNRLERISRKEYKNSMAEEPAKPMPTSTKTAVMHEKMANFSFNLDIRGQRGDEALQSVDNFIDDAIMLGYPELRIVHGKGDGILRNLIRNHLKGYKQVQKMIDEHPDRGGAGVTIVTMA